MLSVKEAQEIIKRELHIDSRSIIVETKSSFGHMLSEDVYSPVNIPYYPTSTRDGYAWNSKWTLERVHLNTTRAIPAGKLPESTVTDVLETVYENDYDNRAYYRALDEIIEAWNDKTNFVTEEQ